MKDYFSRMKAICRNCHFLAKECREENTGRALSFSLNESERKLMQSHPMHAVADHFSLKCHMGIWDEGVSQPPGGRDVAVNKAPRKVGCFFFPYHSAMLFDAAIESRKRNEEKRQLKSSNMYARIGLWIAVATLVASAIIAYFKS